MKKPTLAQARRSVLYEVADELTDAIDATESTDPVLSERRARIVLERAMCRAANRLRRLARGGRYVAADRT